jgi:hypothetical protein
MTMPPPDRREEIDVVAVDPLSLERQRSRYASRGVAYLVLLNGIGALILLASVAQLAPQVEDAKKVVDAMLVFGSGAAVALASTFFAYLRRTVRLQAPERVPLRSGLWWLSLLAAMAGAACFLIGLNMAGQAVVPELESRASFAPAGTPNAEKQRKGDRESLRGKREKGKDGKTAEKGEKRDQAKKSGNGSPEKSKEEGTKSQVSPAAPTPATDPGSEPREPAGPQPLTRVDCERAGKRWNESGNVCD